MATHKDRVRIWNSLFNLAWLEARQVFQVWEQCTTSDTFDPDGGVLPPDEFHVLAAVVLCNLAIEARANHLIEDLFEDGVISQEVARAARHLPPKEKWFLIPALAGITTKLDAKVGRIRPSPKSVNSETTSCTLITRHCMSAFPSLVPC